MARRLKRKFWLKLFVLILIFACGGAYLAYIGLKTSRDIVERFSGQLWGIPTRIYSAPLTLVKGELFSTAETVKYLDRLGYIKVGKIPSEPGEFFDQGGKFHVCLRKSALSSLQSDEGCFSLTLFGKKIENIGRNGGQEGPLSIRIEPLLMAVADNGSSELRTLTTVDRVPTFLKEAIVYMEDRKFYTHHGVSPKGILRALYNNLFQSGVQQGGSTLTQQLVKNFFLNSERTFSRKLKEAWISLFLEVLYSKNQILEAYLNEIYLGQQGNRSIHGFGEAAKFYFAKDLEDLSISEQATLVGLVPSPGKFSPYLNPEDSLKKRNIVLEKMLEAKKLTATQYKRAKSEPVVARGRQKEQRMAPYFVDEVFTDLKTRYPDEQYTSQGWVIQTTLHPVMQAYLEEATQKGIARIRKNKKLPKVEIAAVSIDAFTGQVMAMVGGSAYEQTQFNRATQAKRQMGSLVKPFIASVAFENNVSPLTKFSNEQAEFSFQGEDWKPKNYSGQYSKEVTLREAMEQSLNIPFVNLAAEVGFKKILHQYDKVGFKSVKGVPSVVLGAFEETPLNIARAYSIFPTGGYLPLIRIVNWIHHKDATLLETSESSSSVLDNADAFLTTYLLKSVVQKGTAKKIQNYALRDEVAGKTGTTNEGRDSWFAGFNSRIVTVIWVGDDQAKVTQLTGGTAAVEIWADYMRLVEQVQEADPFSIPKKIILTPVNEQMGCSSESSQTYQEAVKEGMEIPICAL